MPSHYPSIKYPGKSMSNLHFHLMPATLTSYPSHLTSLIICDRACFTVIYYVFQSYLFQANKAAKAKAFVVSLEKLGIDPPSPHAEQHSFTTSDKSNLSQRERERQKAQRISSDLTDGASFFVCINLPIIKIFQISPLHNKQSSHFIGCLFATFHIYNYHPCEIIVSIHLFGRIYICERITCLKKKETLEIQCNNRGLIGPCHAVPWAMPAGPCH